MYVSKKLCNSSILLQIQICFESHLSDPTNIKNGVERLSNTSNIVLFLVKI